MQDQLAGPVQQILHHDLAPFFLKTLHMSLLCAGVNDIPRQKES